MVPKWVPWWVPKWVQLVANGRARLCLPTHAAPPCPQTGRARFAPGALVSVLTTQPLDRALDYRAPQAGCARGDFVEVPLGPRRVLGVVWGAGEGGYDLSRVRPVHRVLDVEQLIGIRMHLLSWGAMAGRIC